MQHTLTFKHDNKKYVSKPFDFEAMCIINDAHNDENKNGPLNICREAVDYMFEGTDATQDIIDAIDVGTHSRLCMELKRKSKKSINDVCLIVNYDGKRVIAECNIKAKSVCFV